LVKKLLFVRRSKNESSHRVIPLNASAVEAAARMFERADLLGHTEPEHYLWPACQWGHRGIGDLMRYAALVSTAEPARIGQYDLLPPDARRVEARLPDEALYALALYVYSLQPPANPNPVSVGTDPSLALRTRKGTGYYKVPMLKGVWYRGHYLHDGSAASLEEMFDPDRLKDSHIRGGFSPAGATTGAIQGHEFGLRLDPVERKQLIAFLRTL
jgi:hypothetical protein